MFIRFAVAALALTSLAAAPASRPTTAPSAPETSAVAEARSALDAARKAAIEREHATVEYVAAQAKADEAMRALANARSSGTPQERLDASATYTRAAAVGKKLEADAIAKDEGMKAATASLIAEQQTAKADEDAAEAKREANAKAAEDREANDPVTRAIIDHRIVKGMTEDQVDKAIGRGHMIGVDARRTVNEREDGTRSIEWTLYRHGAVGQVERRVTAMLSRGVVIIFQDEKENQ